MIFNITDRGPFSTKILNVSSLSALPSGVKEGVMAIISGTKPNDVYVTNTQPASAKAGDLWLYPSSAGKITYIHKGVAIVVGVVRQYNGSAWVAVPATQYKSGAWMSTTVYLLNGTDQGTDYTGGWGCYIVKAGEAYATDYGYVMIGHNTGHQPGGIQTLQKVDLTGYSKIVFVGNVLSYFSPDEGDPQDNHIPRFGIQTAQSYSHSGDDPHGMTMWYNNVAYVDKWSEGEFALTLNVSSYSGSYYVGAATGLHMYITQIRMEV